MENEIKFKRTKRKRSTSSTSCSDVEMSIASSTEDHVMPWDYEDDEVSYPNIKSPAVSFKKLDTQSNTANDLVSSLIISQNCLDPQNGVEEARCFIKIEVLCNLNSTKHHDSPETHSKELSKATTAITPTNVVMSLRQDILNLGQTVATDNWYTSIDLANQLLNQDTHLVGILRQNRKGLPVAVVDAKLEKGESIAMENQRGICMLKWKDKRDVLMLSTKHSNGKKTVLKKGKTVTKPKMILAYIPFPPRTSRRVDVC
ncbi:unnamed protein product [Colias eurytheme]|nr:unnamed protein product [Colias eurytheme]